MDTFATDNAPRAGSDPVATGPTLADEAGGAVRQPDAPAQELPETSGDAADEPMFALSEIHAVLHEAGLSEGQHSVARASLATRLAERAGGSVEGQESAII